MKIAIITRIDYKSPRILAESLAEQLRTVDVETQIFFDIDVLNRLVSYKHSKLHFHYWMQKKLTHYFEDKKIIRELKNMDAVIISECSPNAFWRKLYNIERLKSILKVPVFIYEVYYLGNAPTQIEALQQQGDPLLERYDGHLFVSSVTEIRKEKSADAFCIGLMANRWNLHPLPKKELIALVDFVQPGYESCREMQISCLRKAGISFISLEVKYSIEEIRNIYKRVSIFFVQFPEAFGVPILECLCAGAQVFTSNSGWPMSWRKDHSPEVHGKGILPGCFTVFENEEDLLEKLMLFKSYFDEAATPIQVHNTFIENYPSFYHGNAEELNRWLDTLKKKAP
jgi:hypothetical protein